MGGYIGARAGIGLINTTLGSVQDLTATDASPEVTLINNTHEDGDGGREGKVIFKGQQSGGEESTLAEIEANHFGSSDDEKGSLVFRTNDGSDGASPTEAMRIDSSQNVGIGESSPSLGGSANGLHITGASGNDGVLKLDSSDATHSGKIQFAENGTDQWRIAYDPSNNHLEFTESGVADRMVIADGGNIGINGTPDSGRKLHIEGGDASVGITLKDTAGGQFGISSDLGTLIFKSDTSGSNVGTINSSGNWQFGNTSNNARVNIQGGTSNYGCEVLQNGVSGIPYSAYQFNANAKAFDFRWYGVTIGHISNVGGNGMSYNTSSDYRLKENVKDLSDGIERLKQLSPKRFNFIATEHVTETPTIDGFLAHEAQTVVPEAITGTKDEVDDDGNAVMQGIDQSKLVPLLTAALQEAIAKIEALETKVAALEAE